MTDPAPPTLNYTTLRDKQVVSPPQVVEGHILVERDTTLPRRCVLCNAEGIEPPFTLTARLRLPRRSFRFSDDPLIQVKWYLCAHHHQNARLFMTAGVTFLTASLAMLAAWVLQVRGILHVLGLRPGNDAAPLAILAGILLTVACILFYFSQRSIRVVRNTSPHLTLAGACPAFLSDLANDAPFPPTTSSQPPAPGPPLTTHH